MAYNILRLVLSLDLGMGGNRGGHVHPIENTMFRLYLYNPFPQLCADCRFREAGVNGGDHLGA